MPAKQKDYSGEKYGKLTVISYSHTSYQNKRNRPHRYWLCQCDCGETICIPPYRFKEKRGTVLSCGQCTDHGNRKFSKEESTYQQQYSYHSKTCNNEKHGYLEFEKWKELVSENCITCGASPQLKTSTCGAPVYINGIDRIDSNKGYTLDNVQPMCTQCNRAKWTYSTEEFIEHCNRVVQFSNTKKNKEETTSGRIQNYED